MAVIAKQTRSFSAPTVALVAATAGGDTFVGGAANKAALVLINEDVASVDVTITSQAAAQPGLTSADTVVTVPAASGGVGGTVEIPAPAGGWTPFIDVNGNVNLSYSAVTALFVALVERG